MINCTHYASNTIKIETPDCTILTDPWFTEGIYDGSWYPYPYAGDPIADIGPVDYIYISHIHPDHCDVAFLQAYLQRYPDTFLLITNDPDNPLDKHLNEHGFGYMLANVHIVNNTVIHILPNRTNHNRINIDTALVVTWKEHAVVYMNDNLPDAQQIIDIKLLAPHGIDIAFLPYAGAGPYPQTYYDMGPQLVTAAKKKQARFLGYFCEYLKAFDPKVVVPCSGEYVLGGRLGHLNPYRGNPDALVCTTIDDRVKVLAPGASIDTKDLAPSKVRTEEHSVLTYARDTWRARMAYDYDAIPMLPIAYTVPLVHAYQNAQDACPHNNRHRFRVQSPDAHLRWDATINPESTEDTGSTAITIDQRYLFGLLHNKYHWNNAEIGSHYTTRTDNYCRDLQEFLYAFHI